MGFTLQGFRAVLPPADSNTGKIRNGLHALSVEVQDGVKGGDNGVVVLRDGTIRGGDFLASISLGVTVAPAASGRVK